MLSKMGVCVEAPDSKHDLYTLFEPSEEFTEDEKGGLKREVIRVGAVCGNCKKEYSLTALEEAGIMIKG